MKKTTAAWVKKAETDYQFAVRNIRGADQFHDQLCFLCQQSAEKYLKALLEESGLTVPRTHVLLDVLALLLPHHPGLKSFTRGLIFLTRFAVEVRYPGENASKRQATSALRWAKKVRAACRRILNIRPQSRRRRGP